jgi:hypothetical protein
MDEKTASTELQANAGAFQSSFDAGFPHEHDQWISSVATNWAAMALTLALPDADNVMASRL